MDKQQPPKIIKGRIPDRIVDQKSFLFHVVEKAKLARLLLSLGEVPEDEDHLNRGDPLIALLLEIIQDMERQDRRHSRKLVYYGFARWLLKAIQNDNGIRDRAEYALYSLYLKGKRIIPCLDRARCDPRNWYPNPRQGTEDADRYWLEYEASANLIEEYKTWYNIDLTQEIAITQEHRDLLISAGRAWMEAYQG